MTTKTLVISERKAKVIEELFSALQRLVCGETRIVTAPYKVNQSTVCIEAGRDRSTIKNSAEFTELRLTIDTYATILSKHRPTSPRDSDLAKSLQKKNRNLKEKLKEANDTLDSAVLMIYELNRELALADDTYSRLIRHIEDVRTTTTSVDKALNLSGFDRLFLRESSAPN